MLFVSGFQEINSQKLLFIFINKYKKLINNLEEDTFEIFININKFIFFSTFSKPHYMSLSIMIHDLKMIKVFLYNSIQLVCLPGIYCIHPEL